ncbi:MAG: hypothetical protein WC073_05735 [Sterolibacterium sp.]
MSEKILIANRGDQPPSSGTAAEPNRRVAEGHQGDYAAEAAHV